MKNRNKQYHIAACILSTLVSNNLIGSENKDYAAISCAPGSAQNDVTNCARPSKIYQQGQLAVNLLEEKINPQAPLDNTIKATLQTPSLSWELDHKDETSTTLDAAGNLAIVGSYFHNRLVVFDLSTEQPSLLSTGSFANTPGRRYKVDAVTGASEQQLEQVRLTPDSLEAIVSVTKRKPSSDNRGIGLYRASLLYPETIPEKRFAEDASNTQDFYAFADINGFVMSGDGSKIAIAGEDKRLVTLNTSDFSLDHSFSFSSKVRSAGINGDASYAYAGLSGDRTGLAIMDVLSGTELGFIDTGSQYPQQIETFSNDTRLAFYLRKGETLFIYDNTQAQQPSVLTELEASGKIKTFAISEDGKIALIGINGGKVELFSLDGAARLVESFDTEGNSRGNKPINDLAFVSNERALVSIKNGIQILDIETVSAKE